MTLTEEQRAALKRVVAYMDEMYAIASPYHGCTEDANILRAMIDSSEHFTGASKMIGFDLEKARAEVSTASARRFSESREQARIFCAEEILPDALDEIERLRAALDESEQILAHKTKTSTHWYDEHLQARADRVQTRRVVEQQAARIKALEDALAEYQRLGKIISESVIPCLTVHGNCDQCRPKTKAACEAIAAIRALSIILEYISYDADDDIEICSHAAVLRAMLTEAE